MSVNAASAIFDPSDPYENYPDKRKHVCFHTSMHELPK